MRKTKVDTVAGSLQAVENAKDVEIPEHIDLKPEERLQWGIITRTKARDNWTENDKELAAELAITRCEKNRLRAIRRLAEEDYDVTPATRLRAVLDADRQIDQHVKREERLTRLLQIHAEATVGKARDQRQTNQRAAQAREVLDDGADDFANPLH